MSQTSAAVIHRAMPVAEIVALIPESQGILAEYGLHCFHCAGSEFETLEEGCRTHGFGDDEIDDLVSDLNERLESLPDRPATLVVTASAARGIKEIADGEGRSGEGLVVIADGRGGFCMEFRADAVAGETVFHNDEVPDVRIFASALTLRRIGGSTIDMREGRFKLDLPEDDKANTACGCGGGSCGCGKK